MGIITLTTDFGQRDGYLGAMKGVILSIAPGVRIVDITHDISPQNIAQAAFVIHSCYRCFPRNTIHLVVVDPEVGAERRPIAVRTPRALFVGPDNGVFGYALDSEDEWDVVALAEPRYWRPDVSHTFHGRDIFAPVAAHLARGASFQRMGTPLRDPIRHSMPDLVMSDGAGIRATVLYIDHFGNIVTNLPAQQLAVSDSTIHSDPPLRTRLAGREISGPLRTYAEARPGEFLLLTGSTGLIEVAQREGNAARELQIGAGDAILFRLSQEQIRLQQGIGASRPTTEG